MLSNVAAASANSARNSGDCTCCCAVAMPAETCTWKSSSTWALPAMTPRIAAWATTTSGPTSSGTKAWARLRRTSACCESAAILAKARETKRTTCVSLLLDLALTAPTTNNAVADSWHVSEICTSPAMASLMVSCVGASSTGTNSCATRSRTLSSVRSPLRAMCMSPSTMQCATSMSFVMRKAPPSQPAISFFTHVKRRSAAKRVEATKARRMHFIEQLPMIPAANCRKPSRSVPSQPSMRIWYNDSMASSTRSTTASEAEACRTPCRTDGSFHTANTSKMSHSIALVTTPDCVLPRSSASTMRTISSVSAGLSPTSSGSLRMPRPKAPSTARRTEGYGRFVHVSAQVRTTTCQSPGSLEVRATSAIPSTASCARMLRETSDCETSHMHCAKPSTEERFTAADVVATPMSVRVLMQRMMLSRWMVPNQRPRARCKASTTRMCTASAWPQDAVATDRKAMRAGRSSSSSMDSSNARMSTSTRTRWNASSGMSLPAFETAWRKALPTPSGGRSTNHICRSRRVEC
mmetsp:Transcript_134257/g.388654  ORF Transcript_134257/g.388654 Transcript_134257/m.388654 type:complete len:523 (-) Transcript_134257:657-2225(-)